MSNTSNPFNVYGQKYNFKAWKKSNKKNLLIILPWFREWHSWKKCQAIYFVRPTQKKKKKLNYTLGDNSSLKGEWSNHPKQQIGTHTHRHTHIQPATHKHGKVTLYTCDKCDEK